MTYTAEQAAHDAAVNVADATEPDHDDVADATPDPHAATCPMRQRLAPRVWRSRWDWDPPDYDDPDEPVYEQLVGQEAPRLFALYEAHDRSCPQALDPLDDVREAHGMTRERTHCPATQELRLSLGGYGLTGEQCTRPVPSPPAGLERLADLPDDEPAPLVLERLSLEHNILFGDGEAGKTTTAAKWISTLTRQGHTVLVLDYETHPGEWAYNVRMFGGDAGRVLYASPTSSGWRGAIWDHAETVIEAAQDACLVVIDSATQACAGADPKDDETVTRYGAVMQQLGRPVLTLAHVTKSGESKWPYGSIFWHNLARVTWHLGKVPGGRLLRCRKANAHRKPPPQMVTLTRHEHRWDMWERAQQLSLLDRACDELEDGPLSLSEIVDRINADAEDDEELVQAKSMTKALQRGSQPPEPVVRRTGDGRWERR